MKERFLDNLIAVLFGVAMFTPLAACMYFAAPWWGIALSCIPLAWLAWMVMVMSHFR